MIKMGFGNATLGFVLVLAISLLVVGNEARTIVVGGSQGWRYGFNYTDWAIQNQPFNYGDTLVFKYSPPSKKVAAHSVYTLASLWSHVTCDFEEGKLVANPNEGDGKGFAVVLNEWMPYYFASAESDGRDCKSGLMKFVAIPLPRFQF